MKTGKTYTRYQIHVELFRRENLKNRYAYTRWILHTKHATHPRVKEETKRDKRTVRQPRNSCTSTLKA
jgi:hypothetical protein